MSDSTQLEHKIIPGRFQPGHTGRPPQAYSTVGKVMATCKRLGFDPIEEAIRMFRDPTTKPGPRAQYLQMVCDRYAPKLKAVEHVGANKDIQQVLINVMSATSDSKEAITGNSMGNLPMDVVQPIDNIEQPTIECQPCSAGSEDDDPSKDHTT